MLRNTLRAPTWSSHARKTRLLVAESEGELQAKLDLARIRERASNRGGRNDPRTQSVKEPDTLRKRSGSVKIRMVEQVERLGPKLDAFGFHEWDVFHKRKVEVHQSRADDGVAPEVAIESRLRQSKGAGIEVEVGSSQSRTGGNTCAALRDAFHRIVAEARKQVRAIRYLPSAGSIARTIEPGQDANRGAIGQSEDPVELPAGKQFSSGSGQIPREGKIVGVVQREIIADVNTGQSPVGLQSSGSCGTVPPTSRYLPNTPSALLVFLA